MSYTFEDVIQAETTGDRNLSWNFTSVKSNTVLQKPLILHLNFIHEITDIGTRERNEHCKHPLRVHRIDRKVILIHKHGMNINKQAFTRYAGVGETQIKALRRRRRIPYHCEYLTIEKTGS